MLNRSVKAIESGGPRDYDIDKTVEGRKRQAMVEHSFFEPNLAVCGNETGPCRF